jgi:hypothetical protein
LVLAKSKLNGHNRVWASGAGMSELPSPFERGTSERSWIVKATVAAVLIVAAVVGIVVGVIAVRAAIVGSLAHAEALEAEYTMNRRLGELHRRMYEAAQRSFDEKGFFSPGLIYLDQEIAILEAYVGKVRDSERAVVESALDVLQGDRRVYQQYDGLWDVFESAGGVDPATFDSPIEARRRVRMLWEIRRAHYDVHAATGAIERAYFDRMIEAGVAAARAKTEARLFAERSKIDMQLELCELERAVLDRMDEQMELLVDHWGDWSASTDEDVVWISDDELLSRFQTLHETIQRLEAERLDLARQYFEVEIRPNM